MATLKFKPSVLSLLSFRTFDVTLSSFLIAVFLPIWVMNIALSAVVFSNPIIKYRRKDALGRPFTYYRWRRGFLKSSSVFINTLLGHISFCGVSINFKCVSSTPISTWLPAGIFSIHDLHKLLGYVEMNHPETIVFHQRGFSTKNNISLITKSLFASAMYKSSKLEMPSEFRLFGIKINNMGISQATNWICNAASEQCRLVYFLNVNSINIASSNVHFTQALSSADCILADGSGVRLGAKRLGIALKDNINGTDLLPHLCKKAAQQNQSIFLLGSEPGIAKRTASHLKNQFNSLNIAGTHHGYFQECETTSVIDKINKSNADILLVAMGSPRQEIWLSQNKHRLETKVALAVGGLFDFYSGKIPRAPRWMREIGMEWIFRLIQEPKAKFHRYIIGNPLYLFRLYFLYRDYA